MRVEGEFLVEVWEAPFAQEALPQLPCQITAPRPHLPYPLRQHTSAYVSIREHP
jgi:hypothetical protein